MEAAIEGARRAGEAVERFDQAQRPVDEWIVRIHAPEYKNEFLEAVEAGEPLLHSVDNPMSAGSYDSARMAVATALEAAERIWVEGTLDRAFVIARPPGHHAERANAMGFCFFNTIAVVAERLRALPEIDRVFIFDWDVHHGNGTQHLFEERADVFYASSHRFPFYPGTGATGEIGHGEGRGFTLNMPMQGGAGDAELLRLFEDRLLPAIEQYAPQAILISAGFDAHRRDPLGGMRVTEETYGEMTRRLVELANQFCEGRVLSLLEGGYDMEGLASSVAEHAAAMRG